MKDNTYHKRFVSFFEDNFFISLFNFFSVLLMNPNSHRVGHNLQQKKPQAFGAQKFKTKIHEISREDAFM